MRVADAPLIAPYALNLCRRLAKFLISNFKQPRLRILAARCVRGLPVPRDTCAGWSGGRRQDACEPPLEAGLTYPPRAARRPRAPSDVGRSASRRSTYPPACRPFRGAPVRSAFALSAEGSLLESGPSSDRTSNIYRVVGIISIGISRFPRFIFRRSASASPHRFKAGNALIIKSYPPREPKILGRGPSQTSKSPRFWPHCADSGRCVDAPTPARDNAEVACSRPCQSGALHLVSAPFGTPFFRGRSRMQL
jgi:hypothetical protein